ncbi:hypothetical protein [Mucilaginibacter gotjawali]|uniref:Uncharacterized protein n=2 Tax=Mucilaginibacter gotjawali TaxID=1550579 RepID=A0A120MYJ8_9SPHI|nr:hypothetical protein [Mucilaginibacter gotjawali]MBB3057596.1 hypothetical protein [Mucilaginibacter gotjawali]BAU55257.1 hypothetical protein MgSA37_03438 [Mucilaginibacter gotjawali]
MILDINNFGSFSSEVWGTVSEWAMVGVTSLTAFYLFKTLKSQQDVQRTQNELFKIESLRFKESIKPILKYSGYIDKGKLSDENKKILTIEVMNEANSTALNISKIVSENKQTHQIFIPKGFSDIRDHLVKGDSPIMFHFLIEADSRKSNFLVFNVTYQDISGTKYKQGVFCICDHYGLEIHPYLPEMEM